jgi:hypothetical protein
MADRDHINRHKADIVALPRHRWLRVAKSNP